MRPAFAALILVGFSPAHAWSAGVAPADQAIAAAERRLDAGHPEGYVALASAFMLKARASADPSYYARAAAALDRALALAPADYEAERARAWVLLGQHDFRGALAVAARMQRRQPGDWWNYGTLTDAYVELGDYDRAEDAAQQMIDRRPGVPSYTRVAFLRTIFGDRQGAIELLEKAAQAGSMSDPEGLAWTLVHLGHEHFARGDLVAAGAVYERALAALPDYYLALGALGRIRAAEGRFADAIALYRHAVDAVPAPDLEGALGDVYAAAGESREAERQYALVEYMGRVAEANGTTYGRQLALFLADHDRRPADALRLARQEASTRGDIYTDDALAWALYKNGRLVEAMRTAHHALRLGTEDALLHYHAGMIAAAARHPGQATRHLTRALALNPYFDLRQAPLARATLAGVGAPEQLCQEDHR